MIISPFLRPRLGLTWTWTEPLMYFMAVMLGMVKGTPPHIRSAITAKNK